MIYVSMKIKILTIVDIYDSTTSNLYPVPVSIQDDSASANNNLLFRLVYNLQLLTATVDSLCTITMQEYRKEER
jgi:hypothetical protein